MAGGVEEARPQEAAVVAGLTGEVRAAGGVVHRPGSGGDDEVLLVHRPKYDDWTIPKGKLDPGESDDAAAVREVEEETGVRCRLGRQLPSTRYRDRGGRPKVVRYWEMTPVEQAQFVPGNEVDEIRWLPLGEALRVLTYDRDREVLEALSR
jgi:8-oxo-dGTP diphosphatase